MEVDQPIPAKYHKINQYGNSKGLTKKYVDKKCLLCSIKYIYIYIYIYIYTYLMEMEYYF